MVRHKTELQSISCLLPNTHLKLAWVENLWLCEVSLGGNYCVIALTKRCVCRHVKATPLLIFTNWMANEAKYFLPPLCGDNGAFNQRLKNTGCQPGAEESVEVTAVRVQRIFLLCIYNLGATAEGQDLSVKRAGMTTPHPPTPITSQEILVAVRGWRRFAFLLFLLFQPQVVFVCISLYFWLSSSF